MRWTLAVLLPWLLLLTSAASLAGADGKIGHKGHKGKHKPHKGKGIPHKKQKPKEPVSASLYDEAFFYASMVKFARHEESHNCTIPPALGSTLEKFLDVTRTSTQAGIYRRASNKEFIVAFPGTSTTRDALTDLTTVPVPYLSAGVVHCPGCLVHAGFYTAWNSIAPLVRVELTALLAQSPSYKVTLVGGSLGGSLAHLADAELKTAGIYNVDEVFTFGQPRVGNKAFANFTDKLAGATEKRAGKYHRVTHYNDGVPQLPPRSARFHHASTEYWEATKKPRLQTTYRCFGQEAEDCNDSIAKALNYAFGNDPAHTTYAGYNSANCYNPS